MTEKFQPCKGPQKCYQTFKETSTSTKPLTGPQFREPNAHPQKGINRVTGEESHLRSNKNPCFVRIDSNSIVGSHWRSNHKSVESSSTVRTVKQTQTRQTSSKESPSHRNGSQQKTKDELMGKQQNGWAQTSSRDNKTKVHNEEKEADQVFKQVSKLWRVARQIYQTRSTRGLKYAKHR